QVVHDVHSSAFDCVLKVPSAHALQLRFTLALPARETNSPALQLLHLTQRVAGLASWSQVPAPQSRARSVPPAQYWPTTHGSQLAGPLDVDGAVWRVPAAHSPSGTHMPALVVEEKVPSGQARQIWSSEALPSLAT